MKKTIMIAVVAAAGMTTANAANTQACAACHGADFGKKAMNVSKVVKEMSKEDIVKALKGYKDGSYGGAMKSVMAGQVKNLSDADIEAIAAQIAGDNAKNETAGAAQDAAKGMVEAAKAEAESMAEEMAGKAVDAAANKAKEAATGMLK